MKIIILIGTLFLLIGCSGYHNAHNFGNTIVVDVSFLEQTDNSNEVLFDLLHSWGHSYYEHVPEFILEKKDRQAQELVADNFAFTKMVNYKRNPCAAVIIIRKISTKYPEMAYRAEPWKDICI